MTDDDETNMMLALKQAELAVANGNMPFGAVLADASGRIVCEAHNKCLAAKQRGGGLGDCTRHAEMELVRLFTTQIPPQERASCTLYTSTEPCVMCAGAIYWSGVGRVVYGCTAKQFETLSGPGGFDVPIETLYGMASEGARKIKVKGPFLADAALEVHAKSGIWKFAPSIESAKGSAADQDVALETSLKHTGLGSAAVSDDGVVPVIDLSKGSKEEITRQLWDAATQVGFFSVVGHSIDQSIIDDAFAASETFFAQPLEDKKVQSPLDMSVNCGFEYFAQVRPSTGLADQKESLQITARKGCMDNRWPSPQFQDTAEKLLNAAHALANELLSLLEPLATPQVVAGTLAKSHTLWQEDGQSTLRFLHYPALDADSSDKLLKEGYWRAGPHTDWANLTLLFQRTGQSGLECCANPKSGDPSKMYWTAVNPVEGGIAVNIGDMLARWSDGKLHSNLHRVRLPDDASKPRYSIAFFAQSDKKTLIESTTSEPITAGDYILSRIQSNFAK